MDGLQAADAAELAHRSCTANIASGAANPRRRQPSGTARPDERRMVATTSSGGGHAMDDSGKHDG